MRSKTYLEFVTYNNDEQAESIKNPGDAFEPEWKWDCNGEDE